MPLKYKEKKLINFWVVSYVVANYLFTRCATIFINGRRGRNPEPIRVDESDDNVKNDDFYFTRQIILVSKFIIFTSDVPKDSI